MKMIFFVFFLLPSVVAAQYSPVTYTEEEIRQANYSPAVQEHNNGSRHSGAFTILISGNLNYLYGREDNDYSFDADYIDWHAEAMFGYGYRNPAGNEEASFGIFIRGGAIQEPSLERIIADGNVEAVSSPEQENIFYQVEGGVVIAGLVRVSTGLGFQEYVNEMEALKRIHYYSTTTGLLIGSKNVKLSIDLNLMYGRDLSKTVYRPGLGLALKW